MIKIRGRNQDGHSLLPTSKADQVRMNVVSQAVREFVNVIEEKLGGQEASVVVNEIKNLIPLVIESGRKKLTQPDDGKIQGRVLIFRTLIIDTINQWEQLVAGPSSGKDKSHQLTRYVMGTNLSQVRVVYQELMGMQCDPLLTCVLKCIGGTHVVMSPLDRAIQLVDQATPDDMNLAIASALMEAWVKLINTDGVLVK